MFVTGKESFIPPNSPVIGVSPIINPMLYRFNNLRNTLNPFMRNSPYTPFSSYGPSYVNEIQMYNPISGELGPNISSQGILNDMSQSLRSDDRYRPLINSQIHSRQYNNGKINVGIIGYEPDIISVTSILDKHYGTGQFQSIIEPQNKPQVVQSGNN